LCAWQAWAGKLIIDNILHANSQAMQPVAGLRQVAPYLLLEFGLVLIGSLVSQGRSLFDRILQSQLTNQVNSLVIRKAISLDCNFLRIHNSTISYKTHGGRQMSAHSTSSTPHCK